MEIDIFNKAAKFFCILLFALTACTPQRENNYFESDSIESFMISRFDSIYTHPAKIREELKKAQHVVKDSMLYYRTELFAAYCQYLQGEADSALKANQAVLDFCRRHPERAAMEGMCWNHRYVMLDGINQRDSAIACLHHAYQAMYRTNDRRELENICINLADAYRLKGDLPQASRFYRKALWVVDSLHSKRVKFSIYLGLAQTYTELHNFPLAHHYFDIAEQVPEQRLEYEKFTFYNSKGNCLYHEEKYAEALPCFQQAYQIVKKFQQPSLNALVETNLGEIFTLTGRYDSAHYYLDKAQAFYQSTPTANEEYIFYANSLQAALALRENNLAEANHYLSRPYNPQHIGLSSIYLHNKRFMEYYAQKKDFAKAYEYRLAVEKYDDSIRNIRNVNNIHEIDYRYNQDTTLLRRDIIIANDRVQLSQQRTTLLFVVALLVIAILLAILSFIHIRRKNEQKYNRQMSIVTQLRMENVRNRVSPHYVFNILNIIMPTFKQYSELAHPLQLLIQVLRGNLVISDKIAVELREEIELVKNYIELSRATNPQTVRTEWNIDEQVPPETWIPSMCIQIPVENALKYAFNPEYNEQNLLSVSISKGANDLIIHIEDNGNGYNPGEHTQSKRGTGNGLKMLFRTIELLNSKNTEKIRFDIRNIAHSNPSQHGTIVHIVIPFNYQFKF